MNLKNQTFTNANFVRLEHFEKNVVCITEIICIWNKVIEEVTLEYSFFCVLLTICQLQIHVCTKEDVVILNSNLDLDNISTCNQEEADTQRILLKTQEYKLER